MKKKCKLLRDWVIVFVIFFPQTCKGVIIFAAAPSIDAFFKLRLDIKFSFI